MNKDEMEGKWEKAKGKVKEEVGEATGNRDLEAEGRGQQAAGEVQDTFGKARRKAGEALEDIADKIEDE